MGYFNWRWMYRIIRKRMRPIDPEKAHRTKQNLSVLYMLISWNVLGYVMYMWYTGKKDWPAYYGLKADEEANERPSVYFARLLGVKEARMITYSNLQKKEEIHYKEQTAEQEINTDSPAEQEIN